MGRCTYKVVFDSGATFETTQLRRITHAWLNHYDHGIRFGFSTSSPRAASGATANARRCKAALGDVKRTEITDSVVVLSRQADDHSRSPGEREQGLAALPELD